MMIGDFNDIIHHSEQRGGNFNHNRAATMMKVMDVCNLMEVDRIGGIFTWRRPCAGNCLVYRKLDRAMADVSWCMAFSEAYIEVLCKFHSDYNPLLLRCGIPPQRHRHTLRFESAWITHPSYLNLVKDAWKKSCVNFISCL